MIITKDGKLMNTKEDNAKVDEFLNRQSKIMVGIRGTGKKFVMQFISEKEQKKMIEKLFNQVNAEDAKENPFERDEKTRELRDAFEKKYIQPEVEREGADDCWFAFHDVLEFERENAFRVGFTCAIKLIAEAIGDISEL